MFDALYRDCRSRVAALAGSLTDRQLGTTVAGTPEWTGRDVVAHLVGVASDVVAGNVDGAPGPRWTAAQVASRTGRTVAELTAEWDEVGPAMEAALTGSPLGIRAVLDAHTHEADLRETFRLGVAPAAAVDAVAFAAATGVIHRFGGPGALVVRCVDSAGGEHELTGGDGDRQAVLVITPYELFRGVLSRRSRRQMLAWEWTGDLDPAEVVDRITVFGPREDDQPTPG